MHEDRWGAIVRRIDSTDTARIIQERSTGPRTRMRNASERRNMELGKRQTLVATRATEHGLYFADREQQEVLLPKREVEETMNIGDRCELFVYKDSEDRLIATRKTPLLQMGELKKLRVVQVTKIGAFLDWGLDKDLFLPFKEQTDMVVKNREYLVALYVDKSNRLCATMKIYRYLSDDVKYPLGVRVPATVYQKDPSTGALVALEDRYFGFIPKQEIIGRAEIGDTLTVRIVFRRDDGKYNVSMRQPMLKKQKEDAKELMRLMDEWDGELLVTEKDSPDKIRRICNMSKAEFKRAVGRLLKEERIIIENGRIRKKR